MEDIADKFNRHSGKKVLVEFTNENDEKDTFTFKRMNVEQWEQSMIVSAELEALKEGEMPSPQAIKLLTELLVSIVERSYPDLEKNKVEDFVVFNFEELMTLLPELAPKSLKDEKRAEMIDKLKRLRGEHGPKE